MTDQNRLLNRAVKLDTAGKALVVNITVGHTWCFGTGAYGKVCQDNQYSLFMVFFDHSWAGI